MQGNFVMPYLNLKLSPAATADVADKIAVSLTDLMVECLRKSRDLTVVVLDVVPSVHWHIGGLPMSQRTRPTFYLDVKLTDGTNTKDEKARFVLAAFNALEHMLGDLEPTSYVVIDDVRADAWGYQGHTQEYRYITSKSV